MVRRDAEKLVIASEADFGRAKQFLLRTKLLLFNTEIRVQFSPHPPPKTGGQA